VDKIIIKNQKKILIVISKIFLTIFHNIGLYIYTVKYKSSIKIPDFLQNISKKNKKIIQNIFKKTKHFVAYD